VSEVTDFELVETAALAENGSKHRQIEDSVRGAQNRGKQRKIRKD
jgi:hypothetical protein